MVNALKLVSIRRGHDPRDFALVAFGGGGPLHAAALAEELRIGRVLIPTSPGPLFSAWGMLMSDPMQDFIRTRVVRQHRREPRRGSTTIFSEIEAEAHDAHGRSAGYPRRPTHRRPLRRHALPRPGAHGPHPVSAAARPRRQSRRRFHAAHERPYTFRLESGDRVRHLPGHRHRRRRPRPPSPDTPRRPGARLATQAGPPRVDFDDGVARGRDLRPRPELRPRDDDRRSGRISRRPRRRPWCIPAERAHVDRLGNIILALGGLDDGSDRPQVPTQTADRPVHDRGHQGGAERDRRRDVRHARSHQDEPDHLRGPRLRGRHHRRRATVAQGNGVTRFIGMPHRSSRRSRSSGRGPAPRATSSS